MFSYFLQIFSFSQFYACLFLSYPKDGLNGNFYGALPLPTHRNIPRNFAFPTFIIPRICYTTTVYKRIVRDKKRKKSDEKTVKDDSA